ncbi:MAG: hypothetical protein FWD06_02820 [Oscillospiraceae bacterium]|nr:hypothetical protein [Oscillospiraceae bacterium]
MNEIMALMQGAIYAVFLHNLLFSGGLGIAEMLRAAQRNSEILLTSALISVFSAVSALLNLGVSTWLTNQRYASEWLSWRYAIFSTQLPGLQVVWHALIFAVLLLLLYLLMNLAVHFLPTSKQKILLHKRVGAAALNTLVLSVPLLLHLRGSTSPGFALGMGLGAGVAFLIVTLLVNSGMHILRQNKAIPTQFSGVPATLIYTGLLALAFTGFAGGLSLF